MEYYDWVLNSRVFQPGIYVIIPNRELENYEIKCIWKLFINVPVKGYSIDKDFFIWRKDTLTWKIRFWFRDKYRDYKSLVKIKEDLSHEELVIWQRVVKELN